MTHGRKIKDQIRELEQELGFIEDDLVQLEAEGTYGGPEYDLLVEEQTMLEQDLRALRLADEDDMC